MALYEYLCPACDNRFEKRMPMADVVQLTPCPKCNKQAKKVMGGFALVGRSTSAMDSFGDDDGGDGGDDFGGGDDDFGGHGHGHGPGGHSH